MSSPSATSSWTVGFYRKWRPFLTLPSILRLRAFALREKADRIAPEATIRLQLRRPFRSVLELREHGSDLPTFEEVLLRGVYSDIAELIHGCKTIIDLGANVGLASLYFAGQYPGSRIIAVEPHPESFALLNRNVRKLVDSGRCTPLQAAVWSRGGRKLGMSMPESGGFNGVQVSELDDNNPATATSITMPEILERYQISSVDLLKVDIEGAEVELFSGDLSWLERVQAIAIEFHGDSRIRSGFDAAVERFGFRLRATSPHTVLVSR